MARLTLQDRLQFPRPILMDGATGTELSRRGIDLNTPSWTASVLLDAPETLFEIHRDYVNAGAELVTANTFRTHARNLKSLGLSPEAKRLTGRAVEIAREAAGPDTFVAGSVAPLEDCYSPHLTPADAALLSEHRQMAENLHDAGVDLILIETQVTIREGMIAARAAKETGLPWAISFVCGSPGRLLSGESLLEAYHAVADFSPLAFLVNCLPVEDVLPSLQPVLDLPNEISAGTCANTGRLLADGSWEGTGWRLPAVYAGYAKQWQEANLRWVGGCCGTTPDHIRAVNQVLYGDAPLC